MKPIFIRKYDPAKARMAEDFVYDYVEQGEKTEKQFIKGADGGGRLHTSKTHIKESRQFAINEDRDSKLE